MSNPYEVESLKQKIVKKLAGLRNEYESRLSQTRMRKIQQGLELNTTEAQHFSFENYYQKLHDEIMPELQELQKMDGATVSQIIKTHVNPDYAEVVLSDIKHQKNLPTFSSLGDEVVQYSDNRIQEFTKATKGMPKEDKETLFMEKVLRPFVSANRIKFNILLREDINLAMATLMRLNRNLRKPLCYKNNNPEGFQILKDWMAKAQHNQHVSGSNEFARFLQAYFYYPVEGEEQKNPTKLSAKLIYDALVELGIKDQAKRILTAKS